MSVMYKYDRLYLREDSQTPLKILHMEDIYIFEQKCIIVQCCDKCSRSRKYFNLSL